MSEAGEDEAYLPPPSPRRILPRFVSILPPEDDRYMSQPRTEISVLSCEHELFTVFLCNVIAL